MARFNLFRKKNREIKPETANLPDVVRDDLIKGDSAPGEIKSFFSENGLSGINAVYAFLQADYESRGYNDALINPDESYRTDNVNMLRQDLYILIEKSATYYEGLLREVDFHIGSRSRAGLIDLVEELKTKRELIVDHLEKIRVVKAEAVNSTGATQRITLSYQRGFMRGLSALSQSKVLNKKL
ncbi:MAG: hypothetical protein E4G92_01685 [Bacteroidia bacterium]|nr:MAG: hypothetical protein E4G92_01685 [Bacteroidia bacterium]